PFSGCRLCCSSASSPCRRSTPMRPRPARFLSSRTSLRAMPPPFRDPAARTAVRADPAALRRPERAPQPIVIASLATQTPPESAPVVAPVTTSLLRGTIAPLISSTPAPAPAQFFTINEVMAKHTDKAQDNIQLASVDPTATPDASAYGKE